MSRWSGCDGEGRRALAFAAALALSACGGVDAGEQEAASRPSYCLPGPPSVEVGTGVTSFVPVSPGGSVSIVAGIQGGTHIWISARTRGLGPSALVEYGVNDAASGELLTWQGLRQIVVLDEGEGGGEVHGLTGFLKNPIPAANAGRSATLWIVVTDDCTEGARGEAAVTLASPDP